MKKTIVFGLSGITKGLIENINDNYINASVDFIYIDKEFRDSDRYDGIPIISDLKGFHGQNCIVPTFRYDLRDKWMNLAFSREMEYFSILHQDNYISKKSRIGKGYFIGQKNIIESNVTIGDYFLCGYSNRIGHDSIIGDYFHAYVGGNMGGFNKVGNRVSLCSSSCTKENVIIGDNSIIGLGSVVFKEVPESHTTIGNPAKCIKNI